ncbi:hypothetical protein Pan216_28090 [Planctomycetes bacterium Pan216]|uniref:Inner membrane protein n=1 Tax=Kolteria novifilia TaxID=2527975 RepID=A0A518B4Q6_9BACT|nr:hypothetical protein Pan216_28090 [Planctomycetes bacterium Pan216]
MAAFREHVTVSSLLGVGFAGTCAASGVKWSYAILGGILCGVGGMLPDLDSASGKPIRELFGLLAAVVPMMLIPKAHEWGLMPDEFVLAAVVIYFLIRFGASWFLRQLTVHRGMFHSLPAAFIAAEIAFLSYNASDVHGKLVMACGVMLGFLSHLILDEVYSVDIDGVKIHIKHSAGTALKFFSPHVLATATTWMIFLGLTGAICYEQGIVDVPAIAAHAEQAIAGAETETTQR